MSEGAPMDDVKGSAEHFNAFLPLAEAIEDNDVIPFRADATIVYHNVRAGVDAVLVHRDVLISRGATAEELEHLEEAPSVALAVAFAARQVVPEAAAGTIGPKQARAYWLRRLLLDSLKPCAQKGLVPAHRVEAILSGKGPLDAAQDCIDTAAVYTDHAAALEGKTPVDPAEVKEAAALGTELVTLLRPEGVPAHAPATKTERQIAAGRRDKLWTLLVRRHDTVFRLGAQVFGKKVDDHVPALQSQVLQRSRGAGGTT